MSRKETGRSWMVLFASFMLMFMETGIVKSLGVLLPDIREQFSTQTWVVGFAISLTPGFGAIVSLFSGAVSKVVEPRVTIILCAFLSSVGLFAATCATTLGSIVTALVITGFCTGPTPVAAAAISTYFDDHYNIAITVFSCGMSVGMIVMPLLTQFLQNLYGWRGGILLLSGISFHSVVCGALIKPSKCEYSPVSKSSENETNKSNNKFQWWSSIFEKYLDASLFSNPSFLAILSIDAGTGFCTTGWLIYVVPHALELGFTPYKASIVATAGGIANLLGNSLYPFLATFLSNKALLYISICFIAVSYLLDPVASSYPSYIGLILCAIAFGVGTGLKSNTIYAMFNDAIDEEQLINAVGMGCAMYGLMSVISGFVCGWLYDRSGSYAISFLVLSVVAVVTIIPQCVVDIQHLRKSEFSLSAQPSLF
ncbi:monocarboxylate transporter 13-like [Amphiura filiformis]|uniref:monocarboxylate transporter 13-like n=1 Tax=Amphiura filiformis TaxID=82378 RepID=UPI003B21DD75